MDYRLDERELVINKADQILITGAGGFIGTRVVYVLLKYGFRNLRCLIRPSGNLAGLRHAAGRQFDSLQIIQGNLLSMELCNQAVAGAAVIYHLAAGMDKSYPGAFMNSVVTTRNLLAAAVQEGCLKQFVNVSSFAVYSNRHLRRRDTLDEETPMEPNPVSRGDAYAYAKVKQDELVLDYANRLGVPVTIVRPGSVFGPGRSSITGRVGINTFGMYFHLGGSNKIPFTYVDNCAEAIALAGLKAGSRGQIFNVVDDNLPSSRAFLRGYKQKAKWFRSIYIPYPIFYFLCFVWEKYAAWSKGQLPPVFNRSRAHTEWKGNVYSNDKLKRILGWKPRIPMPEALELYFAYIRGAESKSTDA